MTSDRAVLVRGTGEIASAIAHGLFRANRPVILQDGPGPTNPRRHMAFTDAVFDGRAVLEGVAARRVRDLEQAGRLIESRAAIPLLVLDFDLLVGRAAPMVLIDARMRKRATPERQRGLAPLVIGVGPGFVAGGTVDLAVETRWGEDMGRIIERGSTRPMSGEPRPIEGIGRARFVYAPVGGVFRSNHRIGDGVFAGQRLGTIGNIVIEAPLSGGLRGLTRTGVPVLEGNKVVEVDPRGPRAIRPGIGERPRSIADSILHALETAMI